jgi:hypothetical protein
VSTWWLITVIAGAPVSWQLICAAGATWRERAHVMSVCMQVEAAASNGIVLYERRQDGSALLIVPGTAEYGQVMTADVISGISGEKSSR